MNKTCYLKVCGVVRSTAYGTLIDGKDLNELIRQALRTEEPFAGSILLTITDLSENAKITRIGGNDQTNVDSTAGDRGVHESCVDDAADCGVAAE